ncbi:MAG TPA: MMPL family transporter [Gaiellaceae bacterium]|nr:MMPL family transporter [Gaiellaceae bacterium]
MRLSTQTLASASARHPWRTIGAWIAVSILAIVAIAFGLGNLTTEGAPTNNPESERAIDAKFRAFPPNPDELVTDIVVVRSETYTVDDPQFEAFVGGLAARAESGGLSRARTYLDDPDGTLVSGDRHATLVPVALFGDDEVASVVEAVETADEDVAFAVSITGEQSLDHDFNALSQEDLEKGELQFGLPAALIILLLVFGAVVAGLVPLLMAIVSIVVALGLTALLAQPFEISIFVVNMLTGMGLALGIDYSLFIVSRYREERGRGRAEHDAIGAAGATASRAVLFSGTAFVVAMFGMLLVPNSIMRSLAAGAILVGIVSVVAALTLLPAVLGLLGDRIDSLRIPVVGRRSGDWANPEGRFWGAIVRRVLRRPGLSLGLSAGLLIALALPILGLKIGTSGVTTLPDRFVSKQGFVALERDFPGTTTDPVDVVVLAGASSPEVAAAVERLRSTLATDDRFEPGEIQRSADGEVALLSFPVKGDPSGDDAVAAVRELRADFIPEIFAGTNAEVLVGGTSSEQIDYFDSVVDPTPVVLAFVLGLTFVLLTIVFRSIVVAGTAVALNLLSVGAAYGLLVLVFQHGVGADLLGFQQADTIEAWVPLFLFSVLFGLSMDYQVFLLSRIKERYEQSRDTTDAVSFGVSSTARIITGAALIIVAVFAGFARGDLIMFQQMGFGVAVALLIDATVIRSVLLPSAMKLLGDANWYLPRWLQWLPRLDAEGGVPPPKTRPVAVFERRD